MTITSRTVEPGIVAVTVDFPPVNAIPSRGWFELGEAPIAGWRLVQIAPQGVVLLSPMGNLLHLGFDPEVLPDSDHR